MSNKTLRGVLCACVPAFAFIDPGHDQANNKCHVKRDDSGTTVMRFAPASLQWLHLDVTKRDVCVYGSRPCRKRFNKNPRMRPKK